MNSSRLAKSATGHSQWRQPGGGGGAWPAGLSPGGGELGCLLIGHSYATGASGRQLVRGQRNQSAAGAGFTHVRILVTVPRISFCLPGKSLLAKLSRILSTRSCPCG